LTLSDLTQSEGTPSNEPQAGHLLSNILAKNERLEDIVVQNKRLEDTWQEDKNVQHRLE
jgi:hypothetical protein